MPTDVRTFLRNRCHVRVIRSPKTQRKTSLSWSAAGKLLGLTATSIMAGMAMAGGVTASELPSGGSLVAGDAAITSGNGSGPDLLISQTSHRAIINWQGFSIGDGRHVHFENASGATLNRVTGSSVSSIDGLLSGTGSVFLLNPNGVVIGSSGVVDVGGSFVASTLDISNDAFMAGGDLTFLGLSNAAVINYGSIGALGGDVALIGARVENHGSISAPNGTAALAAGHEVLMRDAALADGKFMVQIGGPDTKAVNTGTIEAAEAELRASHGNVLALSGNTNGVIRANGVANSGGRVFLTAPGGSVNVAQRVRASRPAPQNSEPRGGDVFINAADVAIDSMIDVSGIDSIGGSVSAIGTASLTLGNDARIDASGTTGGFVETSAPSVSIADDVRVTTRGSSGEFGQWLIDPTDFTIYGGAGEEAPSGIGASTLMAALADNNVILETADAGSEPGNLFVNAAVDWDAATTLTLDAHNNIALNAAITGANGGLVLKAGNEITATASIDVGLFDLVSGDWVQNSASLPDFHAGDFRIGDTATFLRVTGGDGGSASPYQIADVFGLQGVGYGSANLSANWVLAGNIDASGTAGWNDGRGFVPIGRDTDLGCFFCFVGTSFSGEFDGAGHVIAGLTIDRPGESYVGLFGRVDGSDIFDVVLESMDINGNWNVGGLVGWQTGGEIIGSSASGSVTGGGWYVGGLVGVQSSSTISGSSASGSVEGTTRVGGLVGLQQRGSEIIGSNASGSVTGIDYVGGLVGWQTGGSEIIGSNASGSVTGGGWYVGGLVGNQTGSSTITDTYATGSVNGQDYVGGLIGHIFSGTTERSYATGSVSSSNTTARIGGLVGSIGSTGEITASYWDSATTGQSSAVGENAGVVDVASLQSSSADAANYAFNQSSYGAFDFSDSGAWFMIDGETRPFLRSEYSTTIRTANQLQLMAMDLSADYTLANDIDLGSALSANGSMWTERGFVPIGRNLGSTAFTGTSFSGDFDGAGHVIAGLTIDRPGESYVGLFGHVNGSDISEVVLESIDILLPRQNPKILTCYKAEVV